MSRVGWSEIGYIYTVANVTNVRTISGFGKRQFTGIVYGHIMYIHYTATVLVVDDTKYTIH